MASMLAKAPRAFQIFISHADLAGITASVVAIVLYNTLHLFCNMSLWTDHNLMKNKYIKTIINRLTSNLAGVKGSSFFDACLSFPGW